jgi:hypothetical protein
MFKIYHNSNPCFFQISRKDKLSSTDKKNTTDKKICLYRVQKKFEALFLFSLSEKAIKMAEPQSPLRDAG